MARDYMTRPQAEVMESTRRELGGRGPVERRRPGVLLSLFFLYSILLSIGNCNKVIEWTSTTKEGVLSRLYLIILYDIISISPRFIIIPQGDLCVTYIPKK